MVGLGREAASAGIPLLLLPSPCAGHTPGAGQGEAKQPLASPLPQTSLHPPELSTAPKPRCSSCAPAPGRFMWQQLLPPVPTAPSPQLLSSVCATLAMGHSCAPHHSPIYLFQHNPSFKHKCHLTWRCSSVCTIQSRCPRAKAPLSWGQHLHPPLPS